jgi:hypothetical protein
MSKAPGSPSFQPPRSNRLLLKLSTLSLSPPPGDVSQQAPPSKEEISPVAPLAPVIALEAPTVVVVEPEASLKPEPAPRPRRNSRPDLPRSNSEASDDDIFALDDEGWSRIANAGGIEEMLKLGEGVSGAVSKCRLRKSGQVFAIKVCQSCII